jgi:bifunctional DNA-binding transcriptional regulator/antitoxin component of YhaV-PrlF toxin-antitoxin module
MYYVQKLIKNKEQYSVTIPKALVKEMGLDKYRVVMLWGTEEHIIHIEGYDAKRTEKRDIPEDQS